MKNSYLLILAVILLLGSRKQDGIKNILSSVSVDDALNLLKLLGVDENLINGVMGILPELLSGGDMSSVIKKALPLILSFANSAKSSGAEHLVQPKTASESAIAAFSTQYQYNKDYFVGDYVTVEQRRFGLIQPRIQLIGMVESFDQNGRSLTPTFKETE